MKISRMRMVLKFFAQNNPILSITSNVNMPKAKKKKPTKDQKQNSVPTEWVGRSVEQLKELVNELQCDLEKARKNRNNAQNEFAAIQSYYDVTRENIRELDMRIEKKDLEIENVEEDNESELKVYEQKSNFVKYCHDQKLKQSKEATASTTEDARREHKNQVESKQQSTTQLEAEKADTEKRLLDEFSSTRTQWKEDMSRIKDQLNVDIRQFEQQCSAHQTLHEKELSDRRTAELHAIESRKNSHLNDIMTSHERACSEMRNYFDGVERQQSIDTEELQAQIRRLKKVAIKHESDRDNLKESNRINGDDLKVCSDTVCSLKLQTKDMEKDRISLNAANARLSATRKAIIESRSEYDELQKKVATLKEEIDDIKNQTQELNSSSVISCNTAKAEALKKSLEKQQKKNDVINQHRSHVVASAGLSGDASKELTGNLSEFVTEANTEIEKLTIKIAQATNRYNNKLLK